MRAALYVRVSTEEQAADGFSLDAQLTKLKLYCTQEGWEIAEVYREEGQSGRNTHRPQYQRMMSEMDRWDVLLVYKLDRIHRNSLEFAKMLEELQRNGKDYCSILDNFDTSTAIGRFARDVTERIAQLESEQTGERVRQAMAYKKSNGGIVSRLPFGYKKQKEVAVVNEDQAYVIRAIFKMVDKGYSYQEVADYLEQGNIPPTNGGRWTKSTIFDIIKRPEYAGYTRYGGILVPGKHPAIIDKELYERLNGSIGSKIIH